MLRNLADASVHTVSGLALGTDTEVHRQSLQQDIPTVAVLAHGFDFLYPSQNRKLAAEILDSGGALITEFTSKRKPDRENFIQRNRIIAGLSRYTIVTETPYGGGSVSTATFAVMYGREVFALPGKITDPCSQGCNRLIAKNKAAAISNIPDLLTELRLNTKKQPDSLFSDAQLQAMLTAEQSALLSSIRKHTEISADDLAEETGLGMPQLLTLLLDLELKGLLTSSSSRKYSAR